MGDSSVVDIDRQATQNALTLTLGVTTHGSITSNQGISQQLAHGFPVKKGGGGGEGMFQSVKRPTPDSLIRNVLG